MSKKKHKSKRQLTIQIDDCILIHFKAKDCIKASLACYAEGDLAGSIANLIETGEIVQVLLELLGRKQGNN